jgi:hypothetical protein
VAAPAYPLLEDDTAVTGTIYVTGTLAGEPEGSSTVSLSWSITAGVSDATVGLSSGANTITVPTGTTLICVIPPSDNTATITVKGVSGDTGYAISPTKPTVLAASGSSLVLTCSAAIAAAKILFI